MSADRASGRSIQALRSATRWYRATLYHHGNRFDDLPGSRQLVGK
jgi:hypothetical protein